MDGMITVELQVDHHGDWWVLNRRRCNPQDASKERTELSRLKSEWENSGYFGATPMRVHTKRSHRG